jgi:hypothetical protein
MWTAGGGRATVHGMADVHETELRAHYERGEERDRLDRRVGRLEFARTTEIVLRHLPPAPALVRTSAEARGAMRCGWPGSGTGWSTGT